MSHKIGGFVRVSENPDRHIDLCYVGRVGVVVCDEDGYDVEFQDGTCATSFVDEDLDYVATAPDYGTAVLAESVLFLDRARKVIYCEHKSIGLMHGILVCNDCGFSAADIVEPISHRHIVTEWERRFRENNGL